MRRRRSTIRELAVSQALQQKDDEERPAISEPAAGTAKTAAEKRKTPHKFESDPTLQHPRCVFQVLKRHFARYTPEMVERCCGIPKEVFLKTAETLLPPPGPEKTGAICYAVGWTQHSNGVQIIRSAAILQLLLGNIGRPGGGIMALRGHASIQGSTDIPTLYDILPGYLPMPIFEADANKLDRLHQEAQRRHRAVGEFRQVHRQPAEGVVRRRSDDQENDFGFDWLPRVTGDHSHFGYWLDMLDGKMEGLFVMGQNPAVGAPNGRLERTALAKLKWLVVRDMVEIETASFWHDSPEVERGELSPETIATEVFLFPAAGTAEKEGTFTNTQRLLQCRKKAVDPPGDARSEAWFMYHLGRRLEEKAPRTIRGRAMPGCNALTWDYPVHGEACRADVRRDSAGDQRTQRSRSANCSRISKTLKNDGSTACGCWIYSGVFPDGENNARTSASRKDYLGHGWGFAWPNDRRILYNRASARPDGKPWSERKKLVWWDETKSEWTGSTRPTSRKDKPPDAQADLATGTRRRGAGRRATVHPASRWRGLALCAQRTEGWSAAGALRAARIAVRQSAISDQQTNPAAQIERARRTILTPIRQAMRVSLTSSRPIADRAPHRGRNDAHAVASRGTAAGVVHRSLSGTGGGSRRWSTATGPRSRLRAAIDRSASAGTRRMHPLVDRRAARPSGRASVPLGISRPGQRRRRERSARDHRRAERAHHGDEGAGVQRSPGRRPQLDDEVAAAIESLTEVTARHERSPPFSPTPRSASAAKPAKSRARNGTAFRRWPRLERVFLRQHRCGRAFDLAAREICGATARAGLRRQRAES